MLLGSIIHNAVVSVDQIGVVPWSLFLWMVWLILHSVYKKCFQMLLLKIKVEESEQYRLIKTYWSLVFSIITIPFALENLSLTLPDLQERYKFILENHLYSWYNNNNSPSIQTKLSYIILTGFYLNNACEISTEKGFNNIDFFHSEFLTVFFVSTFPSKCILFGIAFTSLINVVRCFLEFCKLFTSISRIVNSNFLRKFALIILIFHCFIWCAVYLHILPKYFLFLALEKMNQKSDVTNLSGLVLLNISLWSFYVIEIYKSPLSRIISNYVYGTTNSMNDILFPTSNKDSNDEYDQSDIEFIESEENLISSEPNSNCVNETNQAKQNLLVLYQTVKCVIRVKRKLKKIREKLKEKQSE